MPPPANKPVLILASASPRRRRILLDAGFRFRILLPVAAEVHWTRAPIRTARENALRKGAGCRALHPDACIVAADTVVAFRGRCLNKPASRSQAARWLLGFSNATQRVYTGVYIARPGRRPFIRVVRSLVHFKPLTASIVRRYLQHVDPMDKAGAYDISEHGNLIIACHEGSFTNIMGLPVETVARILRTVYPA